MLVYAGRDISAEEFGYSLSHLESILSSAKSDKLSINSGDVIFYRTEPDKPGSEIRVFVKDKQQKIECEGMSWFHKFSQNPFAVCVWVSHTPMFAQFVFYYQVAIMLVDNVEISVGAFLIALS